MRCHMKTEYKATMQIPNSNTKTIKSEYLIHYLKRFQQTLYFLFCNAYTLNKTISVFLFLSKVSALVFSIKANFHQFGHTFSF